MVSLPFLLFILFVYLLLLSKAFLLLQCHRLHRSILYYCFPFPLLQLFCISFFMIYLFLLICIFPISSLAILFLPLFLQSKASEASALSLFPTSILLFLAIINLFCYSFFYVCVASSSLSSIASLPSASF